MIKKMILPLIAISWSWSALDMGSMLTPVQRSVPGSDSDRMVKCRRIEMATERCLDPSAVSRSALRV